LKGICGNYKLHLFATCDQIVTASVKNQIFMPAGCFRYRTHIDLLPNEGVDIVDDIYTVSKRIKIQD